MKKKIVIEYEASGIWAGDVAEDIIVDAAFKLKKRKCKVLNISQDVIEERLAYAD